MEAAKRAGNRHRTKYGAAFRTEAVRRVPQHGQAATRVAQALGMSEARAPAARPAGSEVLEKEKYSSNAFTSLLNRTQAIASLSRPGNPYDHALAESGWSTLKPELLPREACFVDLEEARLELAEYLEPWYNTQRLHSALGYCTPLESELH